MMLKFYPNPEGEMSTEFVAVFQPSDVYIYLFVIKLKTVVFPLPAHPTNTPQGIYYGLQFGFLL